MSKFNYLHHRRVDTKTVIRTRRQQLKLTEQALADRIGVTRGSVQQWELGETAPNRSRRAAVAAALEISEAVLLGLEQHPELLAAAVGTVQEQTPRTYDVTPPPASADTPSLTPIVAWEHPDDLPEGEYVFIPRLAVRLSAGHGTDGGQLDLDFVKAKPQAFRAEWIRAQRLRPAKLACMTAHGDSMEERIQDGDALVVDTSQTEVMDGKPYALWYEGGERVKRLFRIPGGGLRITSDNKKYPDIVLNHTELSHVRIIGRVVHVAGSGGL